MSESWSILQAAQVFFETMHADFGGAARTRRAFLAAPHITQKQFEKSGRTATCLEAARAEGLPPVIFLHGTPGSAHDWGWFLNNAADAFTVVAVDRPGFGPLDRAAPRLENDMGALAAVLAHYAGGGQRPVVAGHSLGGGLAARLAADYPDRVGGLLLIGASLDPALERILPVQRLFARPPLSCGLSASVRNSNAELIQYIDFLNALRPLLAGVTCSVAVVHSRDDRLVPHANVEYIRRNFLNAAAMTVISPDSGGHFLNKTRMDDVMKGLSALSPGR